MSDVDVLRAKMDGMLKEASGDLDWLEKNGPRMLESSIRSSYPELPRPSFVDDWAVAEAVGILGEATKKYRETTNWFFEILAWLGSPSNLRANAEVFAKMARTVERIELEEIRKSNLETRLPDNWNNNSADEAYMAEFEAQLPALPMVAKHATALETGLKEMADGIDEFYLELLESVVALAVAILALVVALSTLPTGVIPVISAIAAAAAIIDAVISLVMFLIGIFKDRSGEIRSLEHLQWPSSIVVA